MKSLKGQLLIATPELLDPNFARTVTLIVQHDESGALGLVLNRPTGTTIDEAWDQLAEAWDQAADNACLREDTLYFGGPCPGALMTLHTDAMRAQTNPCSGVHFSASEDHIARLVQQIDGDVRFYLGYAGWSPGQLDDELKTGSWMNAPATVDHVFYDGDDLWERVRQDINDAILRTMNVRDLPEDPSLN